ncbi:MAG: hypothetical protein HXL04_00130 [Candidatus Nanosynbacter sp.]|nr:hypothetical protein [Candidatus Nanosynbacter sp.]
MRVWERSLKKAVNYLSADFRAGLDEKDSARIKEASEMLPHNVALEGIGNRMLIRDFLVQTKGELSKYVSTVDDRESDLEGSTRRLFGTIDENLDGICQAAEEYKDEPGGLGMERFRRAFQNSDDAAIIKLAEHIARMDIDTILAINNPYTVMKTIRSDIVEELWKNVQDYRETGDGLEIRENIRKTVVEFVEAIDRDVLSSMMYGDEYAANHA